jgi:integrase
MKKIPQANGTAAIHFAVKEGGQFEWSLSHATQMRLHRLQSLQSVALNLPHDSPHALAARLGVLDGVLPTQLEDIEASAVTPYRIGSVIALDWSTSAPARSERRILCSLTALSWPTADKAKDEAPKDPTKTSNDPILSPPKGLKTALRQWLRTVKEYAGFENPVEELQQDLICWLNEALPAALFAHCAGVSPLRAIPRSAWARHRKRLALRSPPPPDNDISPDGGLTSVVVEAALDATGETFSQMLVDMALDVFKTSHPSKVDGWTKRQWAEGMALLAARVRSAHPSVGILIGWPIHMCEVGTVNESDPASNTVRGYARSALEKLGRELKDYPEDTQRWAASRLRISYQKLLDGTHKSKRNTLSAALSSFHAYLVEWYDVEAIEGGIQGWAPQSQAVSANVVWDFEIDTCISLAERCGDERQGAITACILWIAREQGVRIQDLRRVRLCNVSFQLERDAWQVEIEVVRDAYRGRLKTESSQRRLTIRDPRAVACLRDWYERRKQEMAPESALLFGEKSNDTALYRPAAIHAYLNHLLRAVTGDRDIRFHQLRHTAISNQVDEAFRSTTLLDINPLEVIAASSGHASPMTTLKVYTHLYSHTTRMWLEQALLSSLQISGAAAERHTKIKANTLIQSAKRKGFSLVELSWRRFDEMASLLPIPTVESQFEWAQVQAPASGTHRPTEISPSVVADALLRLQHGQPLAAVASLLDITESQAQDWSKQLVDWLQSRLRAQYPRKHQQIAFGRIQPLIEALGAKSSMLFSERLTALPDYFQTAIDQALLKEAVASWEACSKGDFIALAPAAPARGIFKLLAASGINSRCIRIVVQASPPERSCRTAMQSTNLPGSSKETQTPDKPKDVTCCRGHRLPH